MKLFLLSCAIATLTASCTTLSNRRDLYNPSEDTGPYNSLQQQHPNVPENPPAQTAPLQPAPH